MKSIVFALAALAFASLALAAPPPAPQLTVAATDIRQLEFGWAPVSGAARYELWFRAAPGAAWVKYMEQPAQRAPLFRIGVGVHLLDWPQARYYIRACNSSGCASSNVVDVNGEQLVAMGFIKPAGTTNHKFFGSAVAAAADGKTFAVLDSETMGTTQLSATVHVYRKATLTSGWRREARLLPSNVRPGTGQPYIGDPLAISGDGNVIALGAWMEGSAELGAVYLFRRSGTTWAQVQRIGSTRQYQDRFGYSVKLDDAGRTLVVSRNWSASGPGRGTLEVYRDEPDDGNEQFVHVTTVPLPSANGQLLGCEGIALSGDGQTLLRACRGSSESSAIVQEVSAPAWQESARLATPSQGIAVSFDGTVALLEGPYSSDVWRKGPGGWAYESQLHVVTGGHISQRPSIALSRDGKFAALGNSGEYTLGLGPHFGPYESGNENTRSGGVIVWEHKPSGWKLRRLVKPGSTYDALFGHQVALGDNGKLLIVGAPRDPSNATGIDGNRDDDSAPERGAVWVY